MMGQLGVQRPRYRPGDTMEGQGRVGDPGGWVFCHELKQGVKRTCSKVLSSKGNLGVRGTRCVP